MDNLLNRKAKAYAAVEHVLDKYPDIVASTPVLQSTTTDFKSKLRGIETYRVPEVGGTVPGTNFKEMLMLEVQVNVEVERSAILLYAREKELPDLEGKVPRNSSMMSDGTAEERQRRYESIHEEAKRLGAVLVPYGCDDTVTTELDAQLPLLRTSLSSTQNAIDDRMGSGKQFRKLFKNMDKLLKERLDLAVKTRIKEHPDFVEEYLLARIMPTTPVRKKRDGQVTPKQVKKQDATKKDADTPSNEATEDDNAATVSSKDASPPPDEMAQSNANEVQASENGTSNTTEETTT